MKNKKGFTLAEVLVTLAVIGVVAALTIPALIQSSNTKQATTSLKKAVSVLNQALTMSIAENGVDASCSNCVNGEGLKTLFDGYLSILANTDNSITTPDGMVYSFYADGTACDTTVADNNPENAHCVIEVDINGNKGNEEVANGTSYSDLYYLVLLKNSVMPANGDGTGFQPNDSKAGFRATDATNVDNIAVDAILN